MMLQLDPPIPCRVPPGVDALARIVIDRGPGHHLEWCCQITQGPHAGECWTMANPAFRFNTSLTEGWDAVSPFTPAEAERFEFLGEKSCRSSRKSRLSLKRSS